MNILVQNSKKRGTLIALVVLTGVIFGSNIQADVNIQADIKVDTAVGTNSNNNAPVNNGNNKNNDGRHNAPVNNENNKNSDGRRVILSVQEALEQAKKSPVGYIDGLVDPKSPQILKVAYAMYKKQIKDGRNGEDALLVYLQAINSIIQLEQAHQSWHIMAPIPNLYNGIVNRNVQQVGKGVAGLGVYLMLFWGVKTIGGYVFGGSGRNEDVDGEAGGRFSSAQAGRDRAQAGQVRQEQDVIARNERQEQYERVYGVELPANRRRGVEREQREARERAERGHRQARERIERERVRREEAEKAARERVERVAREQRERIERQQKEAQERFARERVRREEAEKVARERVERVAREQRERIERQQKEAQERFARERVRREEAEKAARERVERATREQRERIERRQKEAQERFERKIEEAERAARERVERVAREQRERVERAMRAQREAREREEANARARRAAQEEATRRAQEDFGRAWEDFIRGARAEDNGEAPPPAYEAPRNGVRYEESHYTTLGIERPEKLEDITDAMIRRAHLQLVRELHPDRNHAPDATNRMQEVNAAHDELRDHRVRYDSTINMMWR